MNRYLRTAYSCFIVLSVLSLNSVATAEGTRGGGESVNINGRPVLRDLVDNTTCTWIPGTTIFNTYPEIKTTLDALRPYHWYLALSLELEIKRLTYCQTTSLIRIPTEDSDGLTIYTEHTEQVAIRLNDMVFFDHVILSQMLPLVQGYVFIHEALHSYFSMTANMRNSKLRSTVAAIQKLLLGQISSDEFTYQLEQNEISIASHTRRIDPDREKFEYVLRYVQPMDFKNPANLETASALDLKNYYTAAAYGFKISQTYPDLVSLSWDQRGSLVLNQHATILRHYSELVNEGVYLGLNVYHGPTAEAVVRQSFLLRLNLAAGILPLRLLLRLITLIVDERDYEAFDAIFLNEKFVPEFQPGVGRIMNSTLDAISSGDMRLFSTVLSNPNFCVNSMDLLRHTIERGTHEQLVLLFSRPEFNLAATALHPLLASTNQMLDVPKLLKMLFERGGFDPNVYDEWGHTPLHRLILSFPADYEARLRFMLSPIARAAGVNPLLRVRSVTTSVHNEAGIIETRTSNALEVNLLNLGLFTTVSWHPGSTGEYSEVFRVLSSQRLSRSEIRDNPRTPYRRLATLMSLLSDSELSSLLQSNEGGTNTLGWIQTARNYRHDSYDQTWLQKLKVRRYTRRLWSQVEDLVRAQYKRLGIESVVDGKN